VWRLAARVALGIEDECRGWAFCRWISRVAAGVKGGLIPPHFIVGDMHSTHHFSATIFRRRELFRGRAFFLAFGTAGAFNQRRRRDSAWFVRQATQHVTRNTANAEYICCNIFDGVLSDTLWSFRVYTAYAEGEYQHQPHPLI